MIDDAIAPFGGFDFPADRLADLPVEIDELDVDCLEGALPGGLDEAKDFGEGEAGGGGDLFFGSAA